MTDEELDVIYRQSATFDCLGHDGVTALLAEVERLRAENAALREIVQAVAEVGAGYSLIDGDCMLHGGCSPEWVGPISDEGYWQHHPDCPVTKARALLAKE